MCASGYAVEPVEVLPIIGHVIFFRKRLADWLTGWLGTQNVILSRSDRLPRRWGSAGRVHRLSMTQWEAAKFDDACKVPTPYLLLSDSNLTHNPPLISFFEWHQNQSWNNHRSLVGILSRAPGMNDLQIQHMMNQEVGRDINLWSMQN